MSVTSRIIQRAALEVESGTVINLGIGMPSKVVDYLPHEMDVHIHCENGVLGASEQPELADIDPFLIDPAGNYISVRPGGCYFDSAVSFAMIRRGKLDMTMIGAFEVDQQGNLANWKIPGRFSPGIGGAMELAQKTQRIIVLMTHCDKQGKSKIRKTCQLPLTASQCVSRVITEKAVMDVTEQGLVLREKAKEVSLEELIQLTEADLIIPEQVGEL